MYIFKRSFKGYLFLFFLAFGIIITSLFRHGLFGDGLMYLNVAFNNFKGYGDFWHQHYSKTAMSFFCEQPPLYFECLSFFYTLFGGAEYAEKIFTICLLFLSVLFIALIWNKLNKKTPAYKSLAWLPSVLLIAVPVYSWTYSNQVIETMVVPLSLCAFYILLVLLDEHNKLKVGLLVVLFTSIAICLLLTKGVQSVFIIAAPFFLSLTNKPSRKKLIVLNFLMGIVFVLSCLLLFLFCTGAKEWLDCYVNKRLIATFNHVGATTTYHAEIIIRYFTELIPVLLFFLFVSIFLKIKNKYSFQLQFKNLISNKKSLSLLLISFSASLPLALTLEQRGFYLVPAFPFIVLAFTNMYKRFIFYCFGNLFANHKKMQNILLVILGSLSLAFFCYRYDTYKDDGDMLHDIPLVKKYVPYGETIRVDPSMWDMFTLHAYVKKYNDNDLSITDTNATYFILNKENKALVPKNYIKLHEHTLWLDIYKNKNKK
jgi:4-amino-4-deoxy-L-arabinose transferase-like glycosyltransferase